MDNRLRTSATIYYHVLDGIKFDFMIMIVIQHLHRRELARTTARAVLGAGAIHLLNQCTVGILVGI